MNYYLTIFDKDFPDYIYLNKKMFHSSIYSLTDVKSAAYNFCQNNPNLEFEITTDQSHNVIFTNKSEL